jgi:hypothetical protein
MEKLQFESFDFCEGEPKTFNPYENKGDVFAEATFLQMGVMSPPDGNIGDNPYKAAWVGKTDDGRIFCVRSMRDTHGERFTGLIQVK